MLTSVIAVWTAHVYPACWTDERLVVSIHIRGAEGELESGRQWSGWEWLVVSIEEERGRRWRGRSGCGLFCGGAERVRMMVIPDQFLLRQRRPGAKITTKHYVLSLPTVLLCNSSPLALSAILHHRQCWLLPPLKSPVHLAHRISDAADIPSYSTLQILWRGPP
ncbi:hypothetical protein L210DRAFT_43463 [Boletus edulis BED1]|uniref:Uncharacterized protein n=1 Tax=Boletus edulis BED1 TaxID=1328754 RepID=A0AAD4C2G3_BOLED|nr:hypothetical protein L210DRAFT_43463 [Boletus edulis BED1]